jgi:hypothetical protein
MVELLKKIVHKSLGKLCSVQTINAKCGVNTYNTSQGCSACGEKVPEKLKYRVHISNRCGLIICRDLNASMEIRTLGLRGESLWRDDLWLWPKSKVSAGSLKQECPSFRVGRKSHNLQHHAHISPLDTICLLGIC